MALVKSAKPPRLSAAQRRMYAFVLGRAAYPAAGFPGHRQCDRAGKVSQRDNDEL